MTRIPLSDGRRATLSFMRFPSSTQRVPARPRRRCLADASWRQQHRNCPYPGATSWIAAAVLRTTKTGVPDEIDAVRSRTAAPAARVSLMPSNVAARTDVARTTSNRTPLLFARSSASLARSERDRRSTSQFQLPAHPFAQTSASSLPARGRGPRSWFGR